MDNIVINKYIGTSKYTNSIQSSLTVQSLFLSGEITSQVIEMNLQMIIDGISHQPTYQSNTYILCTSLQYNSLKPDSLKIKQQVWFSEDFLRSKASRGHFTTISLVSGSNAISYSTTTLHVKLKKESHLNVSTLI